MCIRCEERKARKSEVMSRANEIAELAMLINGEINTIHDALRVTTQVDNLRQDGLLEPSILFMLIGHFAQQVKDFEANNKRLHETLDYVTQQKVELPEASENSISPQEALRMIETIADTFENAQARAAEGANSQIRELKNRFGMNK
ncbi:TPA: hypothetical protein ACTYZB_004828 [Klebsiella variicola]